MSRYTRVASGMVLVSGSLLLVTAPASATARDQSGGCDDSNNLECCVCTIAPQQCYSTKAAGQDYVTTCSPGSCGGAWCWIVH